MNRTLLLAIGLAGAACSSRPTVEQPIPYRDLTVKLAPPAFGYQFTSQPRLVAPRSETYTCDIVRIEPKDGEKLVWINELESRSSQHTHHMNVLAGIFSVADAILGPGKSEAMLGHKLGQYDCKDLGDLMSAGLQTVYPSQKEHQKGRFPDGVAVPLVVPLVMIMQHHYINLTDKPVLVNAALNLHRVEEDRVRAIATGFFGSSRVELAPLIRRIVTKTCQLPRAIDLFAISSHSHERGQCFSIHKYDGQTKSVDPKPFFVNKDWESPPIMFFEQQAWTGYAPMSLRSGDGIHWACHYQNPTTRVVTNGEKASDEMCIFVAIGYPSDLTVGAVKRMVAQPSLDAVKELEKALLPCSTVPVTMATSPWADADRDLPLDVNNPPNECVGFDATLDTVEE